ncbi:two-component sensor histidine kinase [Bombiscardovia apis]|uniref:histidine kinase n=1 Tax=Bombiscardovia apis TaxID=2932182 RepID=A0ABM8BB82_9BIFI|nr:two-component sensor histidine kinase [Bombiscardovia apis]
MAVVAAGGFYEWLWPRDSALWADAVLALVSIALPIWLVFVPVLAFDAGLNMGVWGSESMVEVSTFRCGRKPWRSWVVDVCGRSQREATSSWLFLVLIPALAWMLPIAIGLARFRGSLQMAALVILLASVLTFLAGANSARLQVANQRMMQTEDLRRYTVRQMRARIGDLGEQRAHAERTARLTERTRIAREIHDNVGHQLTRAIMQAQAGQVLAQTQGDDIAARSFAELGQTLDGAMTTIRRSVHDLEDEGTDFAAQIQSAASSLDLGGAGQLDITVENDIASAPAPVARCLAAVIREALNNAARHSPARSASVVLRDLPAFWQLVVQDDGRVQASRASGEQPGPGGLGMTKPVVSEPVAGASMGTGGHAQRSAGLEPLRGMGLADIEARARALGGTAVSGPNERGWRVFVSLPKEPWNGASEKE